MSIPTEDKSWASPDEGEQAAHDLRRQLDAVKTRMRELREGIEAVSAGPTAEQPSQDTA